MSLVRPGKYVAHPERLSEEKFAEVYENQNGNLILMMAFRLDESGHVLRHYFTLAKGQEVRQRTVQDLRERFGWDGADPFWFETADLSDVQVEAVIEDERDRQDPSKVWSRIKWINDPNGRGSGAYAARQVDRRAIGAKYGSLFRACAGGKPVATKPPPPAAPKSVAPSPAPPKAPGRTSSLNECWEKLCEASPQASADERSVNWFAIHEECVPGKTQDDFSPEDWGRVLERIRVMAQGLAPNRPF